MIGRSIISFLIAISNDWTQARKSFTNFEDSIVLIDHPRAPPHPRLRPGYMKTLKWVIVFAFLFYFPGVKFGWLSDPDW